MSPYWAAVRGDGGFTGLQKQLHPEVHSFLFRRFHLRRLDKLTVYDVSLHDRRHVPERLAKYVYTQGIRLWFLIALYVLTQEKKFSLEQGQIQKQNIDS